VNVGRNPTGILDATPTVPSVILYAITLASTLINVITRTHTIIYTKSVLGLLTLLKKCLYYYYKQSKGRTTMMTFEQTGTVFTATNSIKPVIINKNHANQYMLFTPEGRLLDNFTSAGPFVDFETAKRNAECNVGMAMNWSDF
jgi:hypothetical protein